MVDNDSKMFIHFNAENNLEVVRKFNIINNEKIWCMRTLLLVILQL